MSEPSHPCEFSPEREWLSLAPQVAEWTRKNFPEAGLPDYILGVIEELGELTHSHLKSRHGIRGSQEELALAGQDAVGDLSIFLLSLIHARTRASSLRVEAAVECEAEEALLHLSGAVGRLAELAVREGGAGRKEFEHAISELLSWLLAYCHAQGWAHSELVIQTWEQVSQRDWNKHRAEQMGRVEA